MYLNGVPLDAITWEFLEECRSQKVEESVTLDFKEQFPNWQRHRDVREFLRDICAFANTGGGLLLFGVSEERSGNRKLARMDALPGVSLPGAFAALRTQIEDTITGNLEPRFSGFRLREIESPEGKVVIAAGVERSINAPHRVKLTLEFMTRMVTSSVPMDVEQIRLAFRKSAEMRADADARLGESVERARRWHYPDLRPPTVKFWLAATPVTTASLPLPLRDSRVFEVLHAHRDSNEAMLPRAVPGRVAYDHLGAFRCSHQNRVALDRVCRDGTVERATAVRADAQFISHRALADELERSFRVLFSIRKGLGVAGPALLTAGLFGGGGLRLLQIRKRDPQFREDVAETTISENELVRKLETFDEFYGHALKDAADYFWQAAGHQECAGFDEEGNRVAGPD